MIRSSAFLAFCLLSVPLAAQEIGTAGGHGTITRQTGWNDKTQEPVAEEISFSPRLPALERAGSCAGRADA